MKRSATKHTISHSMLLTIMSLHQDLVADESLNFSPPLHFSIISYTYHLTLPNPYFIADCMKD